MVSSETLSKHNSSVESIRNNDVPVKPAIFWLIFYWERIKSEEQDRDGETETGWAADWDRKMGQRRRIGTERLSRVAECRADGSWYGWSSGQASAVPCRPPGADQNSHPNTLHCFSEKAPWSYHPLPKTKTKICTSESSSRRLGRLQF